MNPVLFIIALALGSWVAIIAISKAIFAIGGL